MQLELALNAISHITIAIFFLAILIVLLISLIKEISYGVPLRGVVQLCLAVTGIFAFIALLTVYFHARKIVLPHIVSQRLDTAAISRP